MLSPWNCGFLVPKQKGLLFSQAAPQLADVTVESSVLLEAVGRAPVRVGGSPRPELLEGDFVLELLASPPLPLAASFFLVSDHGSFDQTLPHSVTAGLAQL